LARCKASGERELPAFFWAPASNAVNLASYGTLRTDGAQVNDGGSLAMAANVATQNRMLAGRAKAVHSAAIGAVRQTSRANHAGELD